MEEVVEVMRAGMVGETTQSRWKARAAADAAGGSGVVVYVGKDGMGGKADASDGTGGSLRQEMEIRQEIRNIQL